MDILHKDTKEILLSIDAETLVGADLEDAELSHADLVAENLQDANLEGAELWCADLQYTDLRSAELQYADLEKADLRDADLRGANLEHATLRKAKLSNAKIDYQIQDGLIKTIADTVLKNPEQLEMDSWHTSCGTNHCLAGWACRLNETAAILEATHGTQVAALLTLGAEAHSHFFDSNDDALKFLKNVQQA